MTAPPAVVAGLALAGILAVLPPWMSGYHVSLLMSVFMYVALAGSWNLFSGMTGYVSLGHGLFFGIGAYTFAIATSIFNAPPAIGLVLGVIVCGLIAFLVGLALLTARIRIAYFAVVMLGLNEITRTIVANTKSIGSSYGLTLPNMTSRYFAYYLLLGLAVTVTAFAYGVRQSRWGYGLKAILADEVAAETTGVRTVAHKLAMFVASAVFIGMAGAVIAWNWSYVDPSMAFDLTVSFDMLVMAMFGGFGTVAGPVLGAVVDEPRQGGAVDELSAAPAHHLRRAGDRADPLVSRRHHPGVRGGTNQTDEANPARGERSRDMSGAGSILDVDGLSVSFGGVQALQGVTFQVEPGKIVGVMGPNGAGKTTLFNLITGVYRPSAGTDPVRRVESCNGCRRRASAIRGLPGRSRAAARSRT